MSEEWRPVLGWEGLYEVSSLGRVKSLAREVELATRWGGTTTRRLPERFVTSRKFAGRYWQVDLKERSRGKVTTYVHRLVCAAFHGPAPEGHEVAHRDGNGLNNHIANVRWATHRENCDERRDHGTSQRMAVVPPEDVAAIRALPDGSWDEVFADLYGVRRETIRHTRQGHARRPVT